MEASKVISGDNEEEIWEEIERQFSENPDPFEYNVIIENQGRSISISIDVDMGGGFEGGYATTSITAQLEKVDGFRFALHHQGFIDQMGKFLGMEDVEIGYEDFDEKLIVKTNDVPRLKSILSDAAIRDKIQNFPEFDFHISHHTSVNTEVEAAFLELTIDDAILDPQELRDIYITFITVLNNIGGENSSILRFMDRVI